MADLLNNNIFQNNCMYLIKKKKVRGILHGAYLYNNNIIYLLGFRTTLLYILKNWRHLCF